MTEGRETKRRVVSFGDGSFSACARGSCPISKKEFLKYLAVRGVTLYAQEHRTSVTCPCGTSKLVNIEPRSRFRCHQTLSTASGKMETCPLACIELAKTNEFDRDELATWNMVHVLHALACSQRRGMARAFEKTMRII